jgi:hypothetical protein
LAKRRSEKRTSEPETAMAVAAASAPIEAADDDEDDMVVARAVGGLGCWRLAGG